MLVSTFCSIPHSLFRKLPGLVWWALDSTNFNSSKYVLHYLPATGVRKFLNLRTTNFTCKKGFISVLHFLQPFLFPTNENLSYTFLTHSIFQDGIHAMFYKCAINTSLQHFFPMWSHQFQEKHPIECQQCARGVSAFFQTLILNTVSLLISSFSRYPIDVLNIFLTFFISFIVQRCQFQILYVIGYICASYTNPEHYKNMFHLHIWHFLSFQDIRAAHKSKNILAIFSHIYLHFKSHSGAGLQQLSTRTRLFSVLSALITNAEKTEDSGPLHIL